MFVCFFCELGCRSFFDFVIAAKVDDGLKFQVPVYVFLLWGEFRHVPASEEEAFFDYLPAGGLVTAEFSEVAFW